MPASDFWTWLTTVPTPVWLVSSTLQLSWSGLKCIQTPRVPLRVPSMCFHSLPVHLSWDFPEFMLSIVKTVLTNKHPQRPPWHTHSHLSPNVGKGDKASVSRTFCNSVHLPLSGSCHCALHLRVREAGLACGFGVELCLHPAWVQNPSVPLESSILGQGFYFLVSLFSPLRGEVKAIPMVTVRIT